MVSRQTRLNQFARTNRHLAWIHIAFLFAVSMLPFSTKLLAEFVGYRVALRVYWSNIALLGRFLDASWRYADRPGLVRRVLQAPIGPAIERRIIIAQSLDAIGALLCVVSTSASIAFVVLVRHHFALASGCPRTCVGQASGPESAT